MRKVSDKQILEALETYEDSLTDSDIAVKLGITRQALSQRLKKIRPKIRLKAEELAEKKAVKAIKDLIKQSDEGKTQATALLLELGKVKNKDFLAESGNWRILIERIEPKSEE